jgi:hypothetical protein
MSDEEHAITVQELAKLVPIGLKALRVLQFFLCLVGAAAFSYAGWMYGITNRVANLEQYGSAGLRDHEAKQQVNELATAQWRGQTDARLDAIQVEIKHIGEKLDKVVLK